MVSIQILTGSQAGSTIQITRPTTVIGRDPAQVDIVLTDPSISRSHARLVNNGSSWHIEKIAQHNLLRVNNTDVKQAVIYDNDMIGLGGIMFLFLNGSQSRPLLPAPPSNPKGTLVTERAPMSGSLQGSGIPYIEVSTNTSPDKKTYQLTQPVLNIGRDSSNDIAINANVVSAFHAQLLQENGQFVLVHPHPHAKQHRTTNGLLYRGNYIPGDKSYRKVLARGDIFRIGDENGTLVTLTYNDGTSAPQEVLPAIQPIQLGAPIIMIGRHPDNMVVLSHPQVSGHHAHLEQLPGGGYRIVDLGSTNHVYVNGQRVSSQTLVPKDVIRIGPFKLTYTGMQLTQVDESNGIRIDALQLKKMGNNNTILLNDISLAIPPRKFVAIVGGSGAGKSTLMDALNGLRPAQAGRVFYNGQDYYHSLAAFSTQLGYVPQQDIVHQDITVERALYYAAKMRLPDDFTEAQIQDRIDEVLEDVEMKHRRKLLVSKLSGGQRKRVSIALELLAKPSIFFLDEPTSGLDPGLDRKMMFLLRRLADRGNTIVLVTHATNNINSCDYVCFLAQGGRLAYFGPPDQAKVFFGKSDFAEIYTELEPTETEPDRPARAEAAFQASLDYSKYVTELLDQGPTASTRLLQPLTSVMPRKRGSPWKQFSLLSRRYLELLKNDRVNLAILLLQAPIIGLILLSFILFGIGSVPGSGGFDPNNIVQCPVGPQILVAGQPNVVPHDKAHSTDCKRVENFLKNDPQGKQYAKQRGGEREALQDFILSGPGDAPKILFIMAFAAVMFGCINGAREIVKELPIYKRERAVNLGIVPYMFSKIAVLGGLCLLQSLVIVVLVNWVDPFQESIFLPPALEIYITVALTALAGLMIGLTVSAVVPNNDRAMSIIPVILIPQVIFSGIIFPLTNGVMQVLGFLFPIRWAMAALGTTVGLHSDKLGNDALIGNYYTSHGLIYSTYSRGDATAYLLLTWAALGIMIIGLGWMIGRFLKKKDVKV